MAKKCSVSTCENSYPNTRNVCVIDEVNCKLTPISYHSFPKNPILRKKWIKATGRRNWDPVINNCFICSEHFRESDFAIDHSTIPDKTGELVKLRRFLKRDAVPSQLLGTIVCSDTDLKEDRGEDHQVSSTRQLSNEYQSSENDLNSPENPSLIPETQIKTEPEEQNVAQENIVSLTTSVVVKEECDINGEFEGLQELESSVSDSISKSNLYMNGVKLENSMLDNSNLSLEQKYRNLLEQYLSLKKDYDLMKTKYDIQMQAMNDCENILKNCK